MPSGHLDRSYLPIAGFVLVERPGSVLKAAPNKMPRSSVNAATCLRSFFFFCLDFLVPAVDGERLRSLCDDWSLSLASDLVTSSNLNVDMVSVNEGLLCNLFESQMVEIMTTRCAFVACAAVTRK
jgi:hypothetical protein